jgi:hypothetical protein
MKLLHANKQPGLSRESKAIYARLTRADLGPLEARLIWSSLRCLDVADAAGRAQADAGDAASGARLATTEALARLAAAVHFQLLLKQHSTPQDG